MDNPMPSSQNSESISSSGGLTSMFSGASPKLTFVMGILVGVAGVSLIGFVVAASYAFSGKGQAVKPAANQGATATAPTQPAAAAPTPVNIAIKPTDYVRGSTNAPVTIFEYSDLECPYCKSFHPSVKRILSEYPGKVNWVYRHFPLSFHVNAQKEAEAAECVGKLGGADAYWEFVDKIFERTTSNGTGFALADLYPLAKEVGVSESRFRTCLDQGEMTSKVQADLQEGSSYGVQGTPTSFVNGKPVEGAVPYEQLKAVVEEALKKQ